MWLWETKFLRTHFTGSKAPMHQPFSWDFGKVLPAKESVLWGIWERRLAWDLWTLGGGLWYKMHTLPDLAPWWTALRAGKMAVQREETSKDHHPLVVLPKTPPSSKRPGAFAGRQELSAGHPRPGHGCLTCRSVGQRAWWPQRLSCSLPKWGRALQNHRRQINPDSPEVRRAGEEDPGERSSRPLATQAQKQPFKNRLGWFFAQTHLRFGGVF